MAGGMQEKWLKVGRIARLPHIYQPQAQMGCTEE